MKKLFYLATILLVLTTACSKDSDDEKGSDLMENGLTRDINNFIPSDILNEMKSQGLTINTGNTPPSLEGSFFASPVILIGTNRSADVIGTKYSDNTFTFSNQDNANLTIRIKSRETSSTGQGAGGFIVGKDNYFTIFGKLEVEYDGYDQTGLITQVVSGKLVDGGIEGLQIALFMIDDDGDPADIWIENGDGRTFEDSDEFSERVFSSMPQLKNAIESISSIGSK